MDALSAYVPSADGFRARGYDLTVEPVLVDTLGRPMHDLRISVTDRCNFRCTYCMPREVYGRDFAFLPREELLTFEEITRLARLFASLGVKKLRLTGGEPLLRRDLPTLVSMLGELDGIEDITLTTNGSLLARQAEALAAAGLRRISVSLDSLDEATFARMNDVGFPVSAVLGGIDAAHDAGLTPIKVNMVVRRGINEDSVVPDGALLPRARPHPAFHRVHGRRPYQRLAPGRCCSGRRDPGAHRRRDAARIRDTELRR